MVGAPQSPTPASWTQPVRAPYAAPAPQPAPAASSTSLNVMGFIVLVGALMVVTAQAIQMPDVLDDIDKGTDKATYVLTLVGGWVIGLGLILAGTFPTTTPGARAGFLIAGGVILSQGASLLGLFSGFDF